MPQHLKSGERWGIRRLTYEKGLRWALALGAAIKTTTRDSGAPPRMTSGGGFEIDVFSVSAAFAEAGSQAFGQTGHEDAALAGHEVVGGLCRT